MENEIKLEDKCNQPIQMSFCTTVVNHPPSDLPIVSSRGSSSESDFQSYLPLHLPQLNRLGTTDVPGLLRAVAPEFPEYVCSQGNKKETANSRPVALQPATYTGPRPSRNIEGTRDFSDLDVGDMVLWLRDDDSKCEEYPFWMSKVISIRQEEKTIRVRWYDKVPLRSSNKSTEQAVEYAHWNQSRWQPWWNTFTEEDVPNETRNKKKRKRKSGQPRKVAEEDMALSTSVVFFYGFQLTTDNRISKATCKRIQEQLVRENASQLNNK